MMSLGQGHSAMYVAVLRADNSGFDLANTDIRVMDLRGLAFWWQDEFHVPGGIGLNATVLNSNHRFIQVDGIEEGSALFADVRIDPTGHRITITGTKAGPLRYAVMNTLGQQVMQGALSPTGGIIETPVSASGIHILNLFQGGSVQAIRFWLGSGN
ncbi:MAG TPA: hypothetical protein PK760_13435 [Flavobacteriales bacterium]|nr:hypothetical protein [Flavobacteriales bacterium]